MATVGSPTVSIITVVYNRASQLEATILSVLNQKYDELEYIIIDGGSSDGTVDIIRKYEDQLAYWVSEPDKGIYDAMNKGIAAAKGAWINFMNCGDRFMPDVIAKVFSTSHEDADLIYGNTVIRYPTFEVLYRKVPLKKMWKAMPFCHQSTFVRTSLMREYKFDVSYKLSADFDFLLKAYQRQKRFKEVEPVISYFDFSEGASRDNAILSIKERKRSVMLHCPAIKKAAYYNSFLFYIKTSIQIKKVIGEKSTAWITRLLRT